MIFRLLLVLILTGGLAARVAAHESAPIQTKRSVATLVTAADTIGPDGKARIALRLRLAEGWHTYWRNPGEAGVAVDLAPELGPGAVAGPIEWAAPVRIAEGAIVTYGYAGEILFPVTVTLDRGQDALAGMLRATWLVCRDICVPEEAAFPIALARGTGAPSVEAPLFAAHDGTMPRPSPWTATVTADGTLFVQGKEAAGPAADAWFIPETPDQIVDGAAQTLSARDDGFVLGLKPAAGFRPESGLRGVLSVRDRDGARMNFALTAGAGPAPAPAVSLAQGSLAQGSLAQGSPVQGSFAQGSFAQGAFAQGAFAQSLLFAFLGGLILNLMPCVFPILAMKAAGFASSLARGAARAHAVSYTLGVMAAFAALALALLAARAGGTAAGWGFQFASPMFVTAMAWLLFAVGLNLSGVFSVGGGFAGIGGGLASRAGHWGSFFTGVLAVLVATPCTAPFMSVAIAAGLAAPPAVTVLIFLTMGLGLASPYIALSAVPAFARALPRPGRWMEVLRQFLAFPMYGAAVWLLWVVSQEAGSDGVLAAASGFVLLGFAAWSLGLARVSGHGRLGFAGAALGFGVSIALLTGIGAMPAAPAVERGAETFTPARLAALRAEGRPVFVNLTAAWCVTCLVNERAAIDRDSVRRAFDVNRVVYLKGDWTRQDPGIKAFLREQGRDGVPLYLYYGPNAAPVAVLPQILTESVVLDAVGRPS